MEVSHIASTVSTATTTINRPGMRAWSSNERAGRHMANHAIAHETGAEAHALLT